MTGGQGNHALDRRTFLAGAAAAGAVVTAGCATYGTVATDAVPTTKDASGKTTLSAADVPVNGGVVVASERCVVTQPEAGTFVAFSAVCTHAGCSVTEVAANQIKCPCHGSTFDAASGKVLSGPASAPLAKRAVTASDGTLTIS